LLEERALMRSYIFVYCWFTLKERKKKKHEIERNGKKRGKNTKVNKKRERKI
jgi:hypothetical protein